jgi:hypothetical protein
LHLRCPSTRVNYWARGARLQPQPGSDPIAPTEVPTGWSATREFQGQALSIGATYSLQEEDTGHLSRPEDGYRLRLTPKCLGINVDHRSVIHRLHPSLLNRVNRSVRCLSRLPSVTSAETAAA